MKLKEIIDNEKPREKLEKYGVENLTDSELLSIILRTGNKKESVNELSTRILKEIGSLSKLNSLTLSSLTKLDGIKLSKASTILASFEMGRRVFNRTEEKIKLNNTTKIFDYYKNEFKGATQERFYILLFDTKMQLIKRKTLYIGTVDSIDVHPREIFKEAYLESASFIILMHNHPSGDTTPSDKDIEITERLVEIGELTGIKVVDHIIISSNSYYSFYEGSHSGK